MRKAPLVLACLLAATSLAALTQLKNVENSPSLQIERTGTVAEVIDGDTIRLTTGEKIRLIGIDAPEIYPTVEPGALEAKEFVENICPPGAQVGLNVDDLSPKDKYERTLAIVYARLGDSWVNVNAELLRRGLAKIFYIPPSEFNPYSWLS